MVTPMEVKFSNQLESKFQPTGQSNELPQKVELKVKNKCSKPIEVIWNGGAGSQVLLAVVQLDKAAVLGTFDTHKFIIKFQDGSAGETEFSKGPYDEILYVYHDALAGFDVEVSHPFSLMEDALMKAIDMCPADQAHPLHAHCITQHTFPGMQQIIDQYDDVKTYRDKISDKLRNYSCSDDSMQTSTPISSAEEFVYDREVTVDTYMRLEHAKIWTVHEFISEDECELLMEYSRPRLERAAVAGEAGRGVLSDSRRAQQAGYTVSGEDDELWHLYNRILNFTKVHSNVDLQVHGQDFFTIIQYGVSDEYTNYCDGMCDGLEHKPTGRVSAAVLYCQVCYYLLLARAQYDNALFDVGTRERRHYDIYQGRHIYTAQAIKCCVLYLYGLGERNGYRSHGARRMSSTGRGEMDRDSVDERSVTQEDLSELFDPSGNRSSDMDDDGDCPG